MDQPDRAAVLERDAWTCTICGDPINPSDPGRRAAVIGLVEGERRACHRSCYGVWLNKAPWWAGD